LVAYGSVGYREMLERQITLARRISGFILDQSDDFELLPHSDDPREDRIARVYIIVIFKAKERKMNEQLVQRIKASRKVYVSGTTWDGQPACRIAISNWQVLPEREFSTIKEVLESTVKDYSLDGLHV